MAALLAPYNNSMRLGQGFNSYTQQICLDKAVVPDDKPRTPDLNTTKILMKPLELESDYDYASLHPSTGNGEEVVGASEAAQDPERRLAQGKDTEYKPRPFVVEPWNVPQIVTYSSTFVDKISDVTDSMNISGALEVKTQQVSGSISGSYINSDKFKSSDMNFHIQVKVINQIQQPSEYTVFNNIAGVQGKDFNDVYGDTFVSGWELGGELNAVISVKVLDKSKIMDVKAKLEGELNGPSLSGNVSAKFELTKDNMSKDTETTISINWSGGGSIKHPSEEWNIGSLKRAAAGFPEMVAIMPQRTYAILTKYQQLSDFHAKRQNFHPILYENAGLYTKYLLDSYVDYKVMWKQIVGSIDELEVNRATIELAQPWEDICKLATVKPLPTPSSTQKAITGSGSDDGNAQGQVQTTQGESSLKRQDASNQEAITYPVFQPTFAGLIAARKVCRFEMAKIVQEVESVSKDPAIAADQRRDTYLLDPLVFNQLLPIVRSISPQSASLGVTDPNAALLLGYLQPQEPATDLPPVYNLEASLKTYGLEAEISIAKLRHKANSYRMQGCAGTNGKIDSRAQWFNDLDVLDAMYRPTKFSFWQIPDKLKGVKIQYASGNSRQHGDCSGDPSHSLALDADGSETIVETLAKEAKDKTGVLSIISLSLVTSLCNIVDTSVPQVLIEKNGKNDKDTASVGETKLATDKNDQKKAADSKDPKADTKSEIAPAGTEGKKAETTPQDAEKTKAEKSATGSKDIQPTIDPNTIRERTWTRPDEGSWSLRGFFGYGLKGDFLSLGVIWGKDGFIPVPQKNPRPPLCKRLLCLSPGLQEDIKRSTQLGSFAEHFLIGNFVTTKATDKSPEHFSALDKIDIDWKIKNIAFAAKDNRLTGLRVLYVNGTKLDHGVFTDETEIWNCDTRSDLLVVKMTAGKVEDTGPAYVDTLEFVRADSEGALPDWPLDFSTMRYLGVGDKRVSQDVSEVVERAPKNSRGKWSIRGFCGEHNGGFITKLGVIWGHA